MHVIRRFIFLLLIIAHGLGSLAQRDDCGTQISLLTCSPGAELYSTFGHTAIRVTDSINDIVYNYGTFDFMDPGFYSKFVRGKLNYFLSVEYFADFRYAYAYEQRSITEQVLNLDCSEKLKLIEALETNAQEQNKYYKYDFLFDNCTTRAKLIIQKNNKDSLQYGNILPPTPPSFRNLIHSYLDKADQHWSKLGIDLLLGSKLDRKATNEQAMFLPDYLMKGFDSASAPSSKLVSRSALILAAPEMKPQKSFQPIYIFSLALALILLLSFSRNKRVAKSLAIFDRVLFLCLGLLGVLLLFMWLGTDHIVCRNNLNILWALPTHLPVAFIAWRNKRNIHLYFRITCIICLLLIIGWLFLPQQLNIAVLPLLGIIIVRAYLLSRQKNQ